MSFHGHQGGSGLHARLVGDPDAPTLLLLHGITGSSRYWVRAEPDLSRTHRLVMPDLVGYGESPKPDVDYRISLFVETLRELLEDLRLTDRPLTLVGHSLGSLVGLEYLARYPGSFDRLVLLSVPRHTSREEAHRLFLANSVNYRRILGVNDLQTCLASIREVGPQVFFAYLARFPLQVVRDSSKFSLRSLLTTIEYCLLDYRVDDVLERLDPVPTLMLHGTRDRVAPLENVLPLARRRGWRLVTVRGTGHHLFLTHPRVCLGHIRSFLREPSLVLRTAEGA